MDDATPTRLTRRHALRLLAALSISPGVATAAPPFPARPIRIIVPFAPGSSTDFLARLLAEHLTPQLGQPVTIDNKPGAGGILGTQQLARSAVDGYTLGICSLATLAMVPATLKNAPYEADRDFAPLAKLVSNDMVLAISSQVPAKNLPEFVGWAKQQQKPAFLGTQGAGTSGHFAGIMFGKSAGIKLDFVHYKSLTDLLTNVIAGECQAYFGAPSTIMSHVQAGKLRLLATNGATRLPAFKDAPTFGEAGYPEMQYLNWVGIAAPAKVSADIVARLSTEIIKVATLPQVCRKLEEAGFRVIAGKPAELGELIRKAVPFWRDMARTNGLIGIT